MDSILHPNREKKRPDSKDRHAGEKRLSLVGIKAGKGTKSTESSPRLGPVRSGKFEIIIESGPLVSYGSTANSTGALLSGRLKLVVEDPSGQLTLNKLSLTFRAVICAKKPIGKDCPDCKERHEVLKKETLLSEPRTFKRNEDHQFPFSHLFEGHLPATTVAPLGSISYQIVATGQSSTGEKLEVIHPITIERAITPGPDKSSIRIFPPTNLTARITLPSVVHPIGVFPIQMTMSGVVEKKKDLTTRWRLRKVLWHVDEAVKMISKPCPRHADKVKEGKALQHSESRMVGQDDLKNGWKTDFDTAGGEIMLEFEAALGTKHNTRPVCDVTSPAGLEVKHLLVLELIIAEEFVSQRNPSIITPTGSARVLRMQFTLAVTTRGGMNISWDEEMPPMYEDVPASPPGYGNGDPLAGAVAAASISDYTGPALEYEELEPIINPDNPTEPPRYRERADANAGLPMRTMTTTTAGNARAEVEAGPSGTQQTPRGAAGGVVTTTGWTNDELGAEPPQYRLRRRSSPGEGPAEEDFGEGSAT